MIIIIESAKSLIDISTNILEFEKSFIGSVVLGRHLYLNGEPVSKVIFASSNEKVQNTRIDSEYYRSINYYNVSFSFTTSIQNFLAISHIVNKECICLINKDVLITEKGIEEFLIFASSQNNIEGVAAIRQSFSNCENEIYAELEEYEYIINLSSKNEFNWSVVPLFFFYPNFIDKIEFAMDFGISRLTTFLKFLLHRKQILKTFIVDDYL